MGLIVVMVKIKAFRVVYGDALGGGQKVGDSEEDESNTRMQHRAPPAIKCLKVLPYSTMVPVICLYSFPSITNGS